MAVSTYWLNCNSTGQAFQWSQCSPRYCTVDSVAETLFRQQSPAARITNSVWALDSSVRSGGAASHLCKSASSHPSLWVALHPTRISPRPASWLAKRLITESYLVGSTAARSRSQATPFVLNERLNSPFHPYDLHWLKFMVYTGPTRQHVISVFLGRRWRSDCGCLPACLDTGG